MWIRNVDTGKWSIYQDQLSKDNYDSLKQDLESIKFYSKCLSGATYLLIDQFTNIYESLSFKDSYTWYINSSASSYSITPMPSTFKIKSIDKLSIDDTFEKYKKDYGFTLKTFFTPYKLINEDAENFNQVDVATVSPDLTTADINGLQINLNLSATIINWTIDGVRLLEGHRVLVKDQITFVELPINVDPETYFSCNYYFHSYTATSRTYYYYNSENGIYTYTNNRLVRTDDMDTYDTTYHMSFNVKLGDVNRDQQFHLSRLKNGQYPLVSKNEPIEFLAKHNWILRNQVDYNNVLDINYYDVLKHATQSYTVNNYTYTIPERTIAVGEFGVIINNQDRFTQSYNFSHIINNRYKVNLRGVSQTSGFYWACGDEGTLLKISKVDFSITKIDLQELREFKSVSFYNDTRGIVVGRFNTIYFTDDGGYHWETLEFPSYEAYNYNKVIFTDLDNFFVVGDNGVFIQFSNIAGGWISYLRKITKTVKKDDIYPLVDDLYDIKKANFSNWGLTYSTSATSSYTIASYKEILLISGANSNLIVYDYNNFIHEHDFMFLSWSQPVGDIRSVSQKQGTNQIYMAADSIYKFDINEFSTVGTVVNNIVSSGNKYYKYNIFGSASSASYINQFQQISATAFGLFPSPGTASGKSWVSNTPAWSATEFYVGPEGYTYSTTWTKAVATSSNIQNGSVIDFYSPVTYFGGTYSNSLEYQSAYSYNPNFIRDLVGYLDRLWLVGQRIDNTWTLIQECNQVLDYSGVPAYSLRNYRTTENYKSIGFIVQQDSDYLKTLRGRKVPPYVPSNLGFHMGDIYEFNITVDKPYFVADYYANRMFDFNGSENIIAGNNSLLRNNNYIGSTYSVLDPTLDDKLKSKMIFLDYDVASKLNFFDDNGDYRLPNSATFSGLTGTNNSISLQNLGYEYNWLDYYKDAEKTFKYYTSFSDANVIKFSSTFSYHSVGSSSFTFSKTNLSISVNDILPFAPTIDSATHSRYVNGPTALPVSSPGLTYSVYLYKYLGIFRVPASDPYVEGDVLYLTSDVIDASLLINRRLVIGTWAYLYTYTEFNESILNSLKKSTNINTIINLNKYKIVDDLIQRFDLHPVSIGYKLEGSSSLLTLSCRFNNKTAYYNMQTKLVTTSGTYSLKYEDSFLKFGYSPQYNILDYLNNIDSGFTASKVFTCMPEYLNMPGNNGAMATHSNIYVDTTTKNNRLLFGSDLKFEWQTLWSHTYVDMLLTTNLGSTFSSNQMLITEKYYDSSQDVYVLEFERALNYNLGNNIKYITILSRNRLDQISSDLQILNNIQRKTSTKSIQSGLTFTNFENRLTYKFNTDSYAKILLSDGLVKDKLSAVIYTDNKYQLVMNVVNLEKEFTTNIISTQLYNTGSANKLLVTCDAPHNLNSGDAVVLVFNGGTYSSQYINPQYNGFQTVQVINDNEFYTTKDFGTNPPYSDTGYVKFIRRDAFLNYQPTDIYDLGTDKISKVAVEITPLNVELDGGKFNLVDLNMNKYKYELFDGLTVGELVSSYHWILEAEISNAKIGKSNDTLIWYSGIWKCGRWFDGTWISGTWVRGDWYSGEWNALQTRNKVINIEIGTQQIKELSKWYDGRWFDGTWRSGLWYSGRRYAGDWLDGKWYNGIWNDGTWYEGQFTGGIWVLGNWKNGIFNSDNKPAYWLDGYWSGGDFENGRWFNGEFKTDAGKKSRFGTKASNSRNAIWDSGKWLSGEFHSLLNLDENGNQVAADIHKYSIFKTGIWNQGDFYGGLIFNIDFRGGNFYGGIVDDIQVMGIDINSNKIILNGIFRFNIGDEIWIVDDTTGTSQYSSIGSLNNPSKYKIAYVVIDETFVTTTLTLLTQLSKIVPTNTIMKQEGFDLRLRVVSKFSNTSWKSGLWYNGIFENGNFYGGIWYSGVFNGDWGQ